MTRDHKIRVVLAGVHGPRRAVLMRELLANPEKLRNALIHTLQFYTRRRRKEQR